MALRILHVLDHSTPLHSGYTFRTLAILAAQRRMGWETFHLTSAKHTAGFATEETVDGWQGSVRYKLPRAIESFALRHADQVTTICEVLRGDIAARGIAVDKITVIPNAVDVGSFRFGVVADPGLQQRLGLQGATVLGFAGSFYHYEGLHLLVEAVQRMRARHSQLRVLLVGGGSQEAALKAQVAQAGLGDCVIFTGRVPHAEVHRYYVLIDLLAYPRLRSRLTELGTSLKPLEAMAQGRIFVASDVGGHRELIRHGQTGFLCPAGDAAALEASIEDTLAHRAEWPVVRARARRFVEQERTWANSVARYAGVYERALQARGQPLPAAA